MLRDSAAPTTGGPTNSVLLRKVEMSVLPELEAFLELAEFSRMTGKTQPMHALTPAQARSEFEQSASVFDVPVTAVDSYDVRIPARDGFSVSARLYRRPGLEVGPLPVVVYFHGGGYVIGSLDIMGALNPIVLPSVLALVMTAVFDATGTIRAVAGSGKPAGSRYFYNCCWG